MTENNCVLILWSSCIIAPLDGNMYSTFWSNTRLANVSIPRRRMSFIVGRNHTCCVFSLDANGLAVHQPNRCHVCVTLSRWSCHSSNLDPPLDMISGSALRKPRKNCENWKTVLEMYFLQSGHSDPKHPCITPLCAAAQPTLTTPLRSWRSFLNDHVLQQNCTRLILYYSLTLKSLNFLCTVENGKWSFCALKVKTQRVSTDRES